MGVGGLSGGRAISKRRPITIWSVLALLWVVVGGGLTILLDQLWIHSWAKSGVAAPVGELFNIDLEPGRTLLYYESPSAVPQTTRVHMFNPYQEQIYPQPPAEERSYNMLLTGWSGKAVAEIDVDEVGTYRIVCYNTSVLSDDDIPAEDRIVLKKKPASLTEALTIRRIIQIGGATIVLLGAIGLYIIHGITLHRRASS